MNLSGLSATYPGYEAQEKQTAETHLNQAKARDAAIKLLGQQVLGASLANQGPQAPPPGQASVPAPKPVPAPVPPAVSPPPAAPGVQPSVPAGPAQQPPVPVPPAPGGAPPIAGKMGLQPMIAQILQASPGVAGHPEVLLSALNHAKTLGLLDPEAETKVDEANKLHTVARIGAVKGHLQALQESAKPIPGTDLDNELKTKAPVSLAPPVAALKPNIVTTFANGQKWTVGPDGQPKQVQ